MCKYVIIEQAIIYNPMFIRNVIIAAARPWWWCFVFVFFFLSFVVVFFCCCCCCFVFVFFFFWGGGGSNCLFNCFIFFDHSLDSLFTPFQTWKTFLTMCNTDWSSELISLSIMVLLINVGLYSIVLTLYRLAKINKLCIGWCQMF